MSLDANRRPSLSSFQFLVYVSGGFAMNLTNLVLSQWLYERFVIGGIVSTAAFSLILLAGRLTDGISDPFIAYWTDISYTRWGRRIPFLVFATLPLAIVCFLLWCPPEKAPETMRILYAAAVCQGYFLFYGLVVTPYLALLPEIGNSPRERLNLTTGQGVATLAGTLVFALSGLIIQQFGYPALGLVLAMAVLVSFYPVTFFIREHPSSEKTKGSLTGLFRWIWEVLTNQDFLPLLIGTSLYWFALNLLLMLVPRWVEVRLGLSKEAVTWLMLPFIATNLVGFFFFNWLAKRVGKFASLMLVFALSGVVFCLFGWSDQLGIPVSPLVCAQVVCGLAGLPVAGFGVLAFALLADVINADAGRTGTRREAIYFGVQAILQKSMIGLSVVSFAQIQGTLGPVGLRWIAIIAGLACLAGLICFSRYRLKAGSEELAVKG